jgi:WD40 repeat protein
MKIVLGTYEGNLISWESNFAADPTGRTLQLAYAFSAHGSSVRCLAFDGSEGCDVLVSGGSDETIKIYDLVRHREVGSLLEHKDGITCCKFQGTTHMLSTAQDGSLNIWRTSDWLSLDSLHGAK